MAAISDESLAEFRDIVSRMFDSEDEGFWFYNNYALEKGFSVRKGYVEWDGANKEIILRKLVCSREGYREEKHMKRKREDRKRRPRNITRVGCEAKLVIARVEETGRWFVKDFIDEHTHPLAPQDLACLLRSHRIISDEQKADIIEMEISEIRKHKIMDVLCIQYGGYDQVGCTMRDIYNFCHVHKQQTIAAAAMCTNPTNVTKWKKICYSDIPQQTDGYSCGAYTLKYMLSWDGDHMTEDFTQAQIHIFSWKICSSLMRSDCNRLRMESYKNPITKEEYDARIAELTKGAQDDIMVIRNPDVGKEPEKPKRKRGRPRKNEPPINPVKEQFATKTIVEHVSRNRKKSQHKQDPFLTP